MLLRLFPLQGDLFHRHGEYFQLLTLFSLVFEKRHSASFRNLGNVRRAIHLDTQIRIRLAGARHTYPEASTTRTGFSHRCSGCRQKKRLWQEATLARGG